MKPEPADVSMLKRLAALATLILLMVGARYACDLAGVRAPWYLLHEVVVLGIPMAFLLVELWPRLEASQRLAFVLTSAFFITLSCIAELLAIEHRYWAFYTVLDPLSGFDLGAIPIEEFISYPLLLNLPILWYMWLGRAFAPEAPLAEATSARLVTWLRRGTWLAVIGAAAFIGLALFGVGADLPIDLPAAPDALGAIRYAAGPKQYGWTIVQLLGWAGTLSIAARIAARLPWRRLLVQTLTYFPFMMYVELLACGRGWWVWNTQQTIGPTVWILPVESFSMYLTGGLFTALVYEWVLPHCRPSEANEPLVVS
ncbi:MAG: lycopene cyclase domain-containing protein [Myxococcota bacterium]